MHIPIQLCICVQTGRIEMMEYHKNFRSVIIIGGGLVGSLCACFMGKRGYRVTVFEHREDIRLSKILTGRSINLALSNRGRRALRYIGLEKEVLKAAIPMKGRLLHSLTGQTKSVLYDVNTNQCIYSVGRNYLNQLLLKELEKYDKVTVCFNHKLIHSNLKEGTVTLVNTMTTETFIREADLIIGADGAFSALRRTMQQTPLFQFSQTYIEHGYMELSVPSQHGNQITANHLHIWPRTQFMMIALPNQDGSWTVTIFMPFPKFDYLDTPEKILAFFKCTFPDAVPLIGEDAIVQSLLNLKPSPLVSIKCSPYHMDGKFLIIGDAAHAMVPFYGQGMNAGFEDCLLLDSVLNGNKDRISLSIQEFTLKRENDAHAISDLAMYNYVEMRDLVTQRSFYLRRMFDNFLHKIFPNMWMPLYNSVTFSVIGYQQCLDNFKWQNEIIWKGIWVVLLGSLMLFLYILNIFILL